MYVGELDYFYVLCIKILVRRIIFYSSFILAKNVRRSLSFQAQAYLHMSGGCQEIYIKQKLLAGMIPDTEEALKCDNIVKGMARIICRCDFSHILEFH